jgi:RHS repeat-associated protein
MASKKSYKYYPFGLQASTSWTRENSSNNHLYDAGSELNKTAAWYDLPFRNYDAALGRFMQVDPLAHVDNHASPFAYGGNNPVFFNDPTGLLKASAKQLNEFISKALKGDGGRWSEDEGQKYYGSTNEAIADGFSNAVNFWAAAIAADMEASGGNISQANWIGLIRVLGLSKAFDKFGPGGKRSILNADQNALTAGLFGFLPHGVQEGVGENAPDSRYTQRGLGIDWQDLFLEFQTGEGPEYSIFRDGHPMVEDLKGSWIIAVSMFKLGMSGGRTPLFSYDAPFGLFGVGMSNSMTE